MHKNSEELIALKIENLSFRYKDVPIIKNINLDIKPNKVTTLVGPNGCGKSTLLKTIARILKPSKGTVKLNGDDVHTSPTRQIAKNMALLPQAPIAPEGLKVKELVAQGRFVHQGLFRNWSKEDSLALTQAMQETDITQFADRTVSSLSGGQRQKCWLAMVLAQATDIILLDEPTTFLDLKVQVDVMTLLTKIAKNKGRTLLVVLHELNVAAAFSDNMIMMREGEIVCEGTPIEIMTSKNIKEVFDLDSTIMFEPDHNKPICVPKINSK